MMVFGFVGMLLFWGVLLALLVGGAGVVLRGTTGLSFAGMQRQQNARSVLDERLARGEVTSEEYEAIRAQLER